MWLVGMGGVLPPGDVAVRGRSCGSLWASGVLRLVEWGHWVPPRGVRVSLGVGVIGRRASFGCHASVGRRASVGRLQVLSGCCWVLLGVIGCRGTAVGCRWCCRGVVGGCGQVWESGDAVSHNT